MKIAARPSCALLIIMLLTSLFVPHVAIAGRRETALHGAALRGDVDEVRRLIAQGADLKATDKNGNTALHKAADSWLRNERHADVIAELIERGADVNAQNKDGNTPLHKAARRGDTNAMGELLDRGADAQARNELYETPLHRAALSGEINAAQDLIARGASIHVRGKYGDTPLHHAAYMGNASVVNFLIAKGIKVDVRNSREETPLHGAADYSRLGAARALIAKGADVKVKDQYGETPLHWAAEVWRGKGIVKELIAKGADLNAKDSMGETPLHSSARLGRVNIFKELIAQGAKITTNKDREALLHQAAKGAHIDMIKELIARGADVNARDNAGQTPLHEMAGGWALGEDEIFVNAIKELIAAGADINAKDKRGQTPLAYAIKRKDVRMIKGLIALGAQLPTSKDIIKQLLKIEEINSMICGNMLNYYFDDGGDTRLFCYASSNQSIDCHGNDGSYSQVNSFLPEFVTKLGFIESKGMNLLKNHCYSFNSKMVSCEFDNAETRNKITCENGLSYSSDNPQVHQSSRGLEKRATDSEGSSNLSPQGGHSID